MENKAQDSARKIVLNRKEIADAIANDLFELEAAVDAALASAGKLAANLPQARMKGRISAVVGQEAIDLVGQALTSIITARSKVVAAHNEFADVHLQLLNRPYASGDLWKLVGSASASPALSVVQSEAA